jgi:hypothetical protein
MKLEYTDETPNDYQPPLFKEVDRGTAFQFPTHPNMYTIGSVAMPHHEVGLYVKTIVAGADQEKPVAHPITNQVSDPKTSRNTAPQWSSAVSESVFQDANGETVIEEEPQSEMFDNNGDLIGADMSLLTSPAVKKSNVIKCPCESNVEDGFMIACESCLLWQHAVCVGYRTTFSADEVHGYNCPACRFQHVEGRVDWKLLQDICRCRQLLHVIVDESIQFVVDIEKRLGWSEGCLEEIACILKNDGFISLRKIKKKQKLICTKKGEEMLANVFDDGVVLDKLGIADCVNQLGQDHQDVEEPVSSIVNDPATQMTVPAEISSERSPVKRPHVEPSYVDQRKRSKSAVKDRKVSIARVSVQVP